jgi:hypothetical protein
MLDAELFEFGFVSLEQAYRSGSSHLTISAWSHAL